MAYSALSKFKQKFVEVFDKSAKTEDSPEFKQRIKQVETDEKRINQYLTQVKFFVESSSAAMLSNKQIADSMYVLYQGTPYEPSINCVIRELAKGQEQIEKMEKIKGNLVKVSGIVLEKIKELLQMVE